MSSFASLNLPLDLVKNLEKLKIVTPTPIQSKSIPVIMDGVDLLASAQTGTGKTLAYALPLITRLITDPKSQALVLVPTRELAVQVKTSLVQLLTNNSAIKIAVLIGGEPMAKQLFQLKAHPRIIVGTPGRINDHLKRKSLKLNQTNFVVIDEADRMLDMGFGVQLDQINTFLPTPRQTVMFSATLLPMVIKIATRYLNQHQSISENPTSAVAPKIEQKTVYATSGEKYPALLKELAETEGSVIIFVKTKRNADHLSEKLENEGYNAEAIHGDLRQRQRDKVIKNFREHKTNILVATDIASRGLDVPHIRHVINYDLPHSPEDYIHRIGRTGRAGQEGKSLCLIAPEDYKYWRAIYSLLHPGKKPDIPAGKYSSPAEKPKSRRPRNDYGSPRGGGYKSEPGSGAKRDFRGEARREDGRREDTRREGPRRESWSADSQPHSKTYNDKRKGPNEYSTPKLVRGEGFKGEGFKGPRGRKQDNPFKTDNTGEQKKFKPRPFANKSALTLRKGANSARPISSKPNAKAKSRSSW